MQSLARGLCYSTLPNTWLVHRKTYDGKSFVAINKGDPRFKKFVMEKYDMYNHMLQLRSEYVEKRLRQVDKEEDEESDNDRPLKRPKREVFDKLVADATDGKLVIPVEVKTKSGYAVEVNMIAAWSAKTRLELESNDTNIQLLLQEPADDAHFTPVLPTGTNCSWVPSRHAVTCSYRSIKHNKWFLKSKTIT